MNMTGKNYLDSKGIHLRDRKLSSIDAELAAARLRRMRGGNGSFSYTDSDSTYFQKMHLDHGARLCDVYEAL